MGLNDGTPKKTRAGSRSNSFSSIDKAGPSISSDAEGSSSDEAAPDHTEQASALLFKAKSLLTLKNYDQGIDMLLKSAYAGSPGACAILGRLCISQDWKHKSNMLPRAPPIVSYASTSLSAIESVIDDPWFAKVDAASWFIHGLEIVLGNDLIFEDCTTVFLLVWNILELTRQGVLKLIPPVARSHMPSRVKHNGASCIRDDLHSPKSHQPLDSQVRQDLVRFLYEMSRPLCSRLLKRLEHYEKNEPSIVRDSDPFQITLRASVLVLLYLDALQSWASDAAHAEFCLRQVVASSHELLKQPSHFTEHIDKISRLAERRLDLVSKGKNNGSSYRRPRLLTAPNHTSKPVSALVSHDFLPQDDYLLDETSWSQSFGYTSAVNSLTSSIAHLLDPRRFFSGARSCDTGISARTSASTASALSRSEDLTSAKPVLSKGQNLRGIQANLYSILEEDVNAQGLYIDADQVSSYEERPDSPNHSALHNEGNLEEAFDHSGVTKNDLSSLAMLDSEAHPYKPVSVDNLFLQLENETRVGKAAICASCGKDGTQFSTCPRCKKQFCSRECRIGVNKGGDGMRHICAL